jgi:hypothetical protein
MEASPGKKGNMTCAEFQSVLPYIIDSGGSLQEQEHLRDCPICTDLVADLKYIADQAKLLVPMIEPKPKVWEDIRSSLEREGLVKGNARGRLLGQIPRTRWGPAWMLPIAAVVLLSVGVLVYRNSAGGERITAGAQPVAAPVSTETAGVSDSGSSMGDSQDQQLLSQVNQQVPSLRQTYEHELQSVNSYISDARSSVQRDPDDEEARQALMEAYGQKAMVYDMAMQHSLR